MPKRVDHSKRKQEIADAMLIMIYQHGIENVTLREIADEVGLSLGSVQYYFSKQKELYEFTLETLYNRTETRITNVKLEENSPFENGVNLLKKMVPVEDAQQRMENDVWAQFSLMAHKYPEYSQLLHRYSQSYEAFIINVLKMLDENDCLGNSKFLEAEAKTLSIFMDGLMYHTVVYPAIYNEQLVEDQIREYLSKISR